MKKISLLCDYEYTLLRLKGNYHLKGSDDDEKEAITSTKYLMRYVFENLLHWTPYDVRDYLSYDIIKMFRLENCMDKAINYFPQELNPKYDLFYIASWLYPDDVPYRKERIIHELYKQILEKQKTFTNKFFAPPEGKENFKICLLYSLSQDFINKTPEYIYTYFSDNDKAVQYMKNACLNNHYMKFYDSIIEAVHDALPSGDKNELLMRFILFTNAYDVTKNSMEGAL